MHSKGTNLTSVRKLLRAAGDVIEKEFLRGLPADVAEVYQTAQAMSRVPVDKLSLIFEQAAVLLYPGRGDALRRLGRDIAIDNLTGVYKLLLKVVTVPFVISQVGKLWSTYNDEGEATVEQSADGQSAVINVRGAFDYPVPYREQTAGYIAGGAELCGAKNVRVEISTTAPGEHVFRVAWD
jgi:uncharacterized protein (TIGR02265 family)